MAIFILLPKSKAPKIDVRTLFASVEDADGNTVGYTFAAPNGVIHNLDHSRRPIDVVGTAALMELWKNHNNEWTKDSKDEMRLIWGACSKFQVTRSTKVTGNKGYACQHPVTLAGTVNPPKKSDWFIQ